jgi:hypothetical protein
MDLLMRLDASDPMKFDPSGHDRLRMAKRIRRTTLRTAGADALIEQAMRHFVVPPLATPMASQLARPLFPPLPEQPVVPDWSQART